MRMIETGELALRRLFSALVENTFQTELGVADPALTDYLAELLGRFLHVDALFVCPGLEGQRFGDLVEIVSAGRNCDIETDEAIRRQHVLHRQIGDVALYWTGMFPETLRRLAKQNHRDALLDLPGEAKRSYTIASLSCAPDATRLAAVLRRLADQFELCCEGLRHVRQQWDQLAWQPHRRAG